MVLYYLRGTQTMLTREQADDIAFNKAPAVARHLQDEEYYVAFFATGPIQPGQFPFILHPAERAKLEERK